MMREELALALDFLDEHPMDAVRTLEQHDISEVAAFLELIPDDYASQVLALSLPSFAANICRNIGPENAARLLLEHGVNRMVAVLRHLDVANVARILHECPASRKKACQLLMHYPLHHTGAWILPNTAVVSEDFKTTEVLGFLKEATEETFSKYVFIVDRDAKPVGRISYLALLKAQADSVMRSIMEPYTETISAQMLLSQTAKLPCWEHGDVMPVTGLQQEFIGVLRHVDLRRGLEQQSGSQYSPEAGGDPLSGLLTVYGQSMLALFDSASNVVDRELNS